MRLGRYELIDKIAEGFRAEIFRARASGPAGFQRMLLIKRLRPELARDAAVVAFFREEARTAARLIHSNIAQVFESGHIDGVPYVAMELLHGLDLAQVLLRNRSVEPLLPLHVTLNVAVNVCRALAYAHSRINAVGRPDPVIHRRLSPRAVVLCYEGAVKLINFSAGERTARPAHPEDLLAIDYAYWAPEQADGELIDVRTDIFALGAVLYECVVGQPAFRAEDEAATLDNVRLARFTLPSRVVPSVPRQLEAILLRALARDPEARYQSADELEHDIERFAQSSRLTLKTQELARWMRVNFPVKSTGRSGAPTGGARRLRSMTGPATPPSRGLDASRTTEHRMVDAASDGTRSKALQPLSTSEAELDDDTDQTTGVIRRAAIDLSAEVGDDTVLDETPPAADPNAGSRAHRAAPVEAPFQHDQQPSAENDDSLDDTPAVNTSGLDDETVVYGEEESLSHAARLFAMPEQLSAWERDPTAIDSTEDEAITPSQDGDNANADQPTPPAPSRDLLEERAPNAGVPEQEDDSATTDGVAEQPTTPPSTATSTDAEDEAEVETAEPVAGASAPSSPSLMAIALGLALIASIAAAFAWTVTRTDQRLRGQVNQAGSVAAPAASPADAALRDAAISSANSETGQPDGGNEASTATSARGSLAIDGAVRAEVLVDGTATGRQAPISVVDPLQLTPGQHRITLVTPHQQVTLEVRIVSGQLVRVSPSLHP